MRRFIEMHVRYNDGSSQHEVLTVSQARAKLVESRDAINRTSESFTVAGAMRDIMDEQTVEIHYHTFKVLFEIVPTHFNVVASIGAWGEKVYKIEN